jgi:Zn-finger nucleic acid-binding protein
MKCPACPDTRLVMSDRQGVEIDYCPDCRGVWLDRGELDKIIERSLPAPTSAARYDDDDDDFYKHKYEVKYDKHGRPYKKSKTKSLLGEIFDF